MTNLVSVCITTYNRAELILDTLDSVYSQNHRPIEVIICDDASNDDTADVLSNWKINFQSDVFTIHILRNKFNMGAPYSRNRAIQESRGSFIQFLDSDDLLHPQKISIQVKALMRNPVAQCAWNPHARFSNHDLPTYVELDGDNYVLELRSDNPFDYEMLPSSALHRALNFTKAGLWNESLKRWQDLEYHVRLFKNFQYLLIFVAPLYFFRQHHNGRINDQYKKIEGIENGMLTLRYVGEFILKNFQVTREIKLAMFQFYLTLYLLGLSLGKSNHQVLVLKKLFFWAPNNFMVIKTVSLFLINYMPSVRLKKVVLKKYL